MNSNRSDFALLQRSMLRDRILQEDELNSLNFSRFSDRGAFQYSNHRSEPKKSTWLTTITLIFVAIMLFFGSVLVISLAYVLGLSYSRSNLETSPEDIKMTDYWRPTVRTIFSSCKPCVYLAGKRYDHFETCWLEDYHGHPSSLFLQICSASLQRTDVPNFTFIGHHELLWPANITQSYDWCSQKCAGWAVSHSTWKVSYFQIMLTTLVLGIALLNNQKNGAIAYWQLWINHCRELSAKPKDLLKRSPARNHKQIHWTCVSRLLDLIVHH